MIKITKSIRNNKKLCNIVRYMNTKDAGNKHYCCRPKFARPNSQKGYLHFMSIMAQLKTFTWEQLIMSSNVRDQVIKQYDVNLKQFADGVMRFGHTSGTPMRLMTFHEYVNRHYNCYKCFFRNYGIIKAIREGKHIKYVFTKTGAHLLNILMHK